MMKIVRSVGRFLTSTQTPLWLLGAAFTTTVLINYFVDRHVSYGDDVQDSLIEISSFANDITVMSAVFANALMERDDSYAAAQRQLVVSIMELYAELENPSVQFSDETAQAADETRSSLVRLKSVVDELNDPSQLGKFWVELANVLEARNEFLDHLEAQKRLF
ncbi:hypothetical protein [Oceanicola granulosus]|nr:hypothetical protein [Oceanicola granulosus]